jgi:hypothetical protein
MLTRQITTKITIPMEAVLRYAQEAIKQTITFRIVERPDDLEKLAFDWTSADKATGLITFEVRATRRIGLDANNAQDSVLEGLPDHPDVVRQVRSRKAKMQIEKMAKKAREPLPLP